ncbi:MAG: hypothetical protein IID44_15980 [Planctomycetes bacterium]|nr:hypothetical protein [Planctomycetota bacterium]
MCDGTCDPSDDRVAAAVSVSIIGFSGKQTGRFPQEIAISLVEMTPISHQQTGLAAVA